MLRVKVSTRWLTSHLVRQTPGNSCCWGRYQFSINDASVQECDYWIIYEGLTEPEVCRCPAENVVLITGEPPSGKRYDPNFLQQFHHIVTSHTDTGHPRATLRDQGLPWHAGMIYFGGNDDANYPCDYDRLSSMAPPNKEQTLSAICSDSLFNLDHKKRFEFVRWLKGRLGDRMAWFGKGIQFITDKWEGLADFKYTIAIENCAMPHYWTEKLADAYLAWCHPFYFGCTNIGEYFPAGSFTWIDINDPERAFRAIEEAIAGNLYERNMQALMEARNRVLNRYNYFAVMADICNSLKTNAPRTEVKLVPEWYTGSGAGRVAVLARKVATYVPWAWHYDKSLVWTRGKMRRSARGGA